MFLPGAQTEQGLDILPQEALRMQEMVSDRVLLTGTLDRTGTVAG